MVFYGLSRKFFDWKLKINDTTDFIFSGLFFHVFINIAAKFFVYQLNIPDDTKPYSCPLNMFSREFSGRRVIFMHNTLT